MAIIVNLDVMMAKRKMSLNELSQKVDITLANLSILKNNKAKAVRFSTLEAICKALDCQPGDILEMTIYRQGQFLTVTVTVGEQIQSAMEQKPSSASVQQQCRSSRKGLHRHCARRPA